MKNHNEIKNGQFSIWVAEIFWFPFWWRTKNVGNSPGTYAGWMGFEECGRGMCVHWLVPLVANIFRSISRRWKRRNGRIRRSPAPVEQKKNHSGQHFVSAIKVCVWIVLPRRQKRRVSRCRRLNQLGKESAGGKNQGKAGGMDSTGPWEKHAL